MFVEFTDLLLRYDLFKTDLLPEELKLAGQLYTLLIDLKIKERILSNSKKAQQEQQLQHYRIYSVHLPQTKERRTTLLAPHFSKMEVDNILLMFRYGKQGK